MRYFLNFVAALSLANFINASSATASPGQIFAKTPQGTCGEYTMKDDHGLNYRVFALEKMVESSHCQNQDQTQASQSTTECTAVDAEKYASLGFVPESFCTNSN